MTITVLSRNPNKNFKFSVLIDNRWIEYWDIGQIKRAVSQGATLNERNSK